MEKSFAMPVEPVATVEECCEQLLRDASIRLSASEVKQLKKEIEEFASSTHAIAMQKWIVDNHNKPFNIFTKYFFSGSLHLSQKHSLPIGENYSVVIADAKEECTLVNRCTLLIYSILLFYKNLKDGVWKDFKERNSSGYSTKEPLDMESYFQLFCSSRIPTSTSMDIQFHCDSNIDFIIICHRGSFYKLKVLNYDTALEIVHMDRIAASIQCIINSATATHNTNVLRVGALTCLDRLEAAAERQLLLNSELNAKSLKAVEESLFMVCIEDEVLPSKGTSFSHEEERQFFNYGIDRWYEKSMQLIVLGNGRAAFNFEHSFVDSGPVHTFCSIVHSNFHSLLAQHIHTERKCLSINSSNSDPLQLLEWNLGHHPCEYWNELVVQFKERVKQRVTAYDFVIEGIGSEFFKEHRVSPDAAFQVSIALALSISMKRHIYNLETVDSRHYLGSRLMIIPTLTRELIQLFDTVSSTSLTAEHHALLLPLFINACTAHKKLVPPSSQPYYLQLGVFLVNELQLNDLPTHPINNSTEYSKMFEHDIVSSNLGYYSGVECVYSGTPPVKDMLVIGYVLEHNRILVTLTDSRANRDDPTQTIRDTIQFVKAMFSENRKK